MRAGVMTLLLAGTALTVACQKKQADQNIVITNNIPADADIETLPPDESSETPSNELATGTDNADVNDIDNNAY